MTKVDGIKFTARFNLQGKIREFIKGLNYDIQKVSGFNRLDQASQDELIKWQEIICRQIKDKLVVAYQEIVDDMAASDSRIFALQVRTEEIDLGVKDE